MSVDAVEVVAPVAVKRPIWRSILAVAWSFIGIRKTVSFKKICHTSHHCMF